jgi:hypothetical protein
MEVKWIIFLLYVNVNIHYQHLKYSINKEIYVKGKKIIYY